MTNTANQRPLPDTILPAQFFSGSPAIPERRLMVAVLEDGLEIALRPPPLTRRGRKLWDETDEWLFSDDETWPFSFLTLCHALDIEPLRLRARVVARRWAPGAARQAA